MESTPKRFYYKVRCSLWADGLGDSACTVLLTKAEFKAFKKHKNDISFGANLEDAGGYLSNQGIKYGIDGSSYKVVTERYYRKFEPILNHSEKTYSEDVMYEIEQYVTETDEQINNETDGDAPYYKIELKVDPLSECEYVTNIALTNSEYLTLKNHSSEISNAEILKENVISKSVYGTLSAALNDSTYAKEFLETIEEFLEADEKKEIKDYERDNPESDVDQEQGEDEDEDENEDEDDGDDEDNEDDEDDEEVEEKPLKKKVKKN